MIQISTIVWGEPFTETFIRYGLPSILEAILHASRWTSRDIKLLVNTDSKSLKKLQPNLQCIKHKVKLIDDLIHLMKPHDLLGYCNRNDLTNAEPDDIVVFLNADNVVSIETLAQICKLVDGGKKLILCAGPRCKLENAGTVPIGGSAPRLLQWVSANLHQAMLECFWGSGRSAAPSTVYFKGNESLVTRQFHPHTLAAVPDRYVSFLSTVDDDLIDNYKLEEVHLVTSMKELAVCELSEAHRTWGTLPVHTGVKSITDWAKAHASAYHVKMFEQRIVLQGIIDENQDAEPARLVLEELAK